ncbi:MAG: type I-C CRISPR-associated protein Cas8c/Csd1 [Fimbriimonadia bacterium]
MILKRLVEFWERGALSLPPGYQNALISKMIRLNADGTLRDVITLSGDKRGQREGKVMSVPRVVRSSSTRPNLIADNPEYVLGIPKDQNEKARRRAQERHQAYVDLVKRCAHATGIPEVEALWRWLCAKETAIGDARANVQPGDELNFEVGGTVLTDLGDVQRFWAGPAAAAQGTQRCLVTGELMPVEDRMPVKLKGIPGGQSSGSALVAVNAPAFESYGLKAALNSPISKRAGEAFANAINFMVGERKHHLRLGSKSVYLFWTREETAFDVMSFLDAPDPQLVRDMLKSPVSGSNSDAAEAQDFYALCLSGNSGRTAIRDYLETTIPAVKNSLTVWFRTHQIRDWGTGELRQFGIYQLAASLYLDPNKNIVPSIPAALLRSALTGAPIPSSLLMQALRRNIATQGPFYMLQGRKVISLARLSLIKAVYLSHRPQEEVNTLQSLEHNNTDPGYLCGRLLAILESAQRAASPGIKATLVDRYYGSASSTPASVFGNLLRMTQPHLAKLRKTREPVFHALERRIVETMEPLRGFPPTLTLQQQALFSLGFYHQKAHDRAEARARKELQDLADDATTDKED